MKEKMEILSGTVEDVVFRNDENDYTVFEVNADGELVYAVGVIPPVFTGELVTLKGSWTYHKEFGRQFAFVGFEKKLPCDIEGIITYLSSRTVKGVGPVTAVKIVNRFGIETFDVLENHPEWLTDIPGITMKKAAAISESFCEQSALRSIMVFFKDYIGAREVSNVYKRLGSESVSIVRENPYILCEGNFAISFEKIDKFAASLGFAKEGESRILSGTKYVLSHNGEGNGHTCLPKERLISLSSALLKVGADVLSDMIESFLSEEKLKQYVIDDVAYVMTPENDEAERYVAKRLVKLSDWAVRFSTDDISSLINSVESGMNICYDRLQREALYHALNSGVTIITGGPGTGKTTIVKALIELFARIGWDTVLAAPTGRAAKRLSEATSEEAKTIHRLLEVERKSDTGEQVFGRNERYPIDQTVIIVDEASMIDLSLMNSLLRAIRRGARLVLIGDIDQLPSVGAGNVLSDIIESGVVDTVRLTTVFRQSKESLIVTNAHRINGGEPPILNNTDSDFFFVRRENDEEIAKTISELLTVRLPKTYGESIKEEVQVISPSKKGAGGVDLLNTSLQDALNPKAQFKKEKNAHGISFREGDRVMQVVNNYDIEWEKNGNIGYGLFNGDIGVIESINSNEESMLIRFDDKVVSYDFSSLDDLELAYAITTHKSQGSEYPVVIIPMYYCPYVLMTRNLLYTAITRAKKMVILVGKSDVPQLMVNNKREVLRYTTLKDRLKNSLI
jgi:exodeoxyribonuclease V alpha subunit